MKASAHAPCAIVSAVWYRSAAHTTERHAAVRATVSPVPRRPRSICASRASSRARLHVATTIAAASAGPTTKGAPTAKPSERRSGYPGGKIPAISPS